MGDNYDENNEEGSEVEDFLKNLLCSVKGYAFIAGTYHGKVKNARFIENQFGCKYVSPVKKKHGPQLRFGERVYTMPDMLFQSNELVFLWIESKSSNDSNFNTIDVPGKKLNDYFNVGRETNTLTSIVFTIVDRDSNYCSVYTITTNELANVVRNHPNCKKTDHPFWNSDGTYYQIDMRWNEMEFIYSGEFQRSW